MFVPELYLINRTLRGSLVFDDQPNLNQPGNHVFSETSLNIGAERLTTLGLAPRQSFEVRNKFQERALGESRFYKQLYRKKG